MYVYHNEKQLVAIFQIGEKSIKEIFLDAADLITIVIPPALPAAITIGSLYAENRLKRKGIYCISPRTINVSGSINCVCFDKTGTLTEDGLDLMGVVQVRSSKGDEKAKDQEPTGQTQVNGENVFCELEREAKKLDHHEKFLQGMATCHSLTTIDGKLSGDPIDVIMFEGTGWNLEETMDDNAHANDVRTKTLSHRISIHTFIIMMKFKHNSLNDI